MASNDLCDCCGKKPKFGGHNFCGRTCAQIVSAKALPVTMTSYSALPAIRAPASMNDTGVEMCVNCSIKPRFSGYQFCGKGCAAQYQSSHGSTQGTQSMEYTQHHDIPKPVQPECGCETCGQLAKPQLLKRPLAITQTGGTTITEVTRTEYAFHSVEHQFISSWRHRTKIRPAIKHVYKIVFNDAVMTEYNDYQTSVEAKGRFTLAHLTPGNEHRRWHGTSRACQVGNKGNIQLCASAQCALCCIMSRSFDINQFGRNTHWGRFGRGIYTSSTSSKADDYASNTDPSASLKAMFLTKVIVGKGWTTKVDHPTLLSPPAGYDSVLAEVGGTLNYDELVVYDNSAIRPAYLVMYDAL